MLKIFSTKNLLGEINYYKIIIFISGWEVKREWTLVKGLIYTLLQYFSFYPDFDSILAIAKESTRVDYAFFCTDFYYFHFYG